MVARGVDRAEQRVGRRLAQPVELAEKDQRVVSAPVGRGAETPQGVREASRRRVGGGPGDPVNRRRVLDAGQGDPGRTAGRWRRPAPARTRPCRPRTARTGTGSSASLTLPNAGSRLTASRPATVVRLEALPDEFVNDDRLTLTLVTAGEAVYGAGSVDSGFAIDVRDTTTKLVSAKSDAAVKQAFDTASAAAAGGDGLNPGEEFSVAFGDLFEGIAAGSAVAYSASSSDPSVRVSASSAAVTVTPVSAGGAAVRVTARVTGPPSAPSAVPQTRADEAAVEHTVTVTDVGLRVALTAEPPASVAEGGVVTLTAASNRAVLAGEDATVRLTVVGPVVAPAPTSVTIAVGATSAAAVLTVVDDDEVRDLGNVTVVATGGGLATDPTRLDIAVTEDDVAAVPTYTFSGPADPNLVEGRSYELKVTASAAAAADAVFTLRRDRAASAAGDDDFTLEPASIVIRAGAAEGSAVLTLADDGAGEGSETLVLFAETAAGDEVGSLAFTVWDAAAPAVPLAGQILLAAYLALRGYRRYLLRSGVRR